MNKSHIFSIALAAISAIPYALAQGPADKPWLDKTLPADVRADLVQAQMTADEELTLIDGYFGVYNARVPAVYKDDMPNGAGYVPGIARLGIPALKETDASLGVANGGFMRKGDTAVALPSSLLTAATWNPQIAYAGGAMIGAEARNKGFNVLLAGGINLTREPRGGRTFEYSGEDPYLASVMVGEAIRGIQNLKIISTIKHYALNNTENTRTTSSSDTDDRTIREYFTNTFRNIVENAHVESLMSSYNSINHTPAAANTYTLNFLARRTDGFKQLGPLAVPDVPGHVECRRLGGGRGLCDQSRNRPRLLGHGIRHAGYAAGHRHRPPQQERC